MNNTKARFLHHRRGALPTQRRSYAARYDPGDVSDIAHLERERSSVRRLVAIHQQLTWRVVELQTDLHTANTNIGCLKGQVQDLVRRLQRMGYEPSHKPPSR